MNTLLDFSRIEAGRVEASLRADRSRGVHHRAGERLPIGHREGRPRARSWIAPPLPRAGLRRSRHVGEDRAESALERLQVHLRRRRSRVALDARRRSRRARASATRASASPSRAAAHVRALPSREARARAHPRGHRNRAGARAGAGAPARRHDRGQERRTAAARRSSSRFRTGRAHLPAGTDGAARAAASDERRRRRLRRGGAALAARRPSVRDVGSDVASQPLRCRPIAATRFWLSDDNADMREYLDAHARAELRGRSGRRRRGGARAHPGRAARPGAQPT